MTRTKSENIPTTIENPAESPPNLERRGLCSERVRRRCRLRRVPLARAVPPLAADAAASLSRPLSLSLSPFHFL